MTVRSTRAQVPAPSIVSWTAGGSEVELKLLVHLVPHRFHRGSPRRRRRDGRLRMTLRVADTEELVRWILSFSRGVRVVKPSALRERVQREALAVARQ